MSDKSPYAPVLPVADGGKLILFRQNDDGTKTLLCTVIFDRAAESGFAEVMARALSTHDDLLAAAKKAVELGTWGDPSGDSDDSGDSGDWAAELAQAELRDAIAKAEAT